MAASSSRDGGSAERHLVGHDSAGPLRRRIPASVPIVGVAATPTGKGYWLVGSDGAVYPFGDASALGSLGGSHLNSPIQAMAATADGQGYWLVAADGGVFSFGGAPFLGSLGGQHLNQPIGGLISNG